MLAEILTTIGISGPLQGAVELGVVLIVFGSIADFARNYFKK